MGENLDAAEEVQTELSNQEIARRFPILEGPVEAMIERLRKVDPIMADRWHPKDTRKIRRSLEIFLLTGKKASDTYNEQKENNKIANRAGHGILEEATGSSFSRASSTLLFWVHCESETLKTRLDSRVDMMLEAGLLEEVNAMDTFLHGTEKGGVCVDRSRGIWVSIGWKEFEPYLAARARGIESEQFLKNALNLSIEQTKAATRQYAKRQIRWIRLKLLSALSEADALDNLYLLDGTNLGQWTSSVLDPAINLTGKFLAGEKLCDPCELSDAAKEHLALDKPVDTTNDVHHECQMCHKITVTEEQWQAHLKSRTHRRLIKREQRLAARGMSSLLDIAHKPEPLETP